MSDGATGGSGLNDIPADVAAISAFTKTDDHYTYTFDPDWILDNEDITPVVEFNESIFDPVSMSGNGDDTGVNLDSESAA